jgi:hypothetical protein
LFQRKRKRLPVDFTAAPIAIVGGSLFTSENHLFTSENHLSLRNSQFFILFSELLVAQTSEPNASTTIGNSQARLGDNAVNDLFSAIVVQRVQGVAPAREFATKELGLVPCGVFLVRDVEGLQKKFALCYQPIDSFCILH